MMWIIWAYYFGLLFNQMVGPLIVMAYRNRKKPKIKAMIQNYVDNFDTEQSFWDLYPEFKIKEPFKALYKADKSRSKKESSQMMWFVALCYSKASKFRSMPKEGEDGKHYVIGLDYCEDPNFYQKHQSTIDPLIEMFIQLQYSSMERHLMTWEDLLDNRTAFLKEQRYDLSNYDDLDKMAIGTAKVFDTLKNIWEDLNKEDSAGTVKGGAVASLND